MVSHMYTYPQTHQVYTLSTHCYIQDFMSIIPQYSGFKRERTPLQLCVMSGEYKIFHLKHFSEHKIINSMKITLIIIHYICALVPKVTIYL